MKFALLGAGPEAMQLAEAVRQSQVHQLAAAVQAPGWSRSGPPGLTHWESLFDPALVEAVIVGNSADPQHRADQLRQLVQAAVPMILVHPACETIVGYELDMIRRDTRCIMVPYCPGLMHPAVECLRQLVRQGSEAPMGKVEQLVFERPMQERQRAQVLDRFRRDVFLIRRILGNVTQLSALGPAAAQPNYSNLSVLMSGPDGIMARWSSAPAKQAAGRPPTAGLSLLATTGKATIQLTDEDSDWTWSIPEINALDPRLDSWNGTTLALETLTQAVGGRDSQPTWDEACRATDLADVVDISLRRGRTIDVYTQPCTEEDTFKGIMVIGGCGALVFTLLAVVLLAIIESFDIAVLDRPVWQEYPWRLLYWHNWPFYLLGLLALFLALQLLRFLYPRSHSNSEPTN